MKSLGSSKIRDPDVSASRIPGLLTLVLIASVHRDIHKADKHPVNNRTYSAAALTYEYNLATTSEAERLSIRLFNFNIFIYYALA